MNTDKSNCTTCKLMKQYNVLNNLDINGYSNKCYKHTTNELNKHQNENINLLSMTDEMISIILSHYDELELFLEENGTNIYTNDPQELKSFQNIFQQILQDHFIDDIKKKKKKI